jgi:hypothetical protein
MTQMTQSKWPRLGRLMIRQAFPTVLVLAVFCAAGLSAQSSRLPVNWKGLPEPFATESARNGPTVVPQPEGAKSS